MTVHLISDRNNSLSVSIKSCEIETEVRSIYRLSLRRILDNPSTLDSHEFADLHKTEAEVVSLDLADYMRTPDFAIHSFVNTSPIYSIKIQNRFLKSGMFGFQPLE